MEMGQVSISENNQGWYDYNRSIDDNLMLRISDVPADEEIISMANKFIKEKNINISQYGNPTVEDLWRQEYALAEQQLRPYIPDVINVVYPLIVGGKETKDMSGNDYGLRVNVNIRHKKVSSAYGLGIYNFQSSMYEAITDEKKVLEMAEKGGYGQWYDYDYADARVIEVEIGEPTVNLISYFMWKDGKNEELFIPALVFPVLSQPEGTYYYRRNVIVPLVEDLFNENFGGLRPELRPMPAIQDGATDSNPGVPDTPEIEALIEEIPE